MMADNQLTIDATLHFIESLGASDDPIARKASNHLMETHFLERIANVENGRGNSFQSKVLMARRNTLLKSLDGPRRTAYDLSQELSHYRATKWKEDRKGANPYPSETREHKLFQILKIKDSKLSERQIRTILKSNMI